MFSLRLSAPHRRGDRNATTDKDVTYGDVKIHGVATLVPERDGDGLPDVGAPAEVRAVLAAAIVDEPPLTLHDGGLIRESWSEALATLVAEAREAREWIAGLEARERSRTGLSSLRVRFNRVFGYGIEVTHAHTARVPGEYIRRQTLTGAERYITPELKDHESRVLGADERRRLDTREPAEARPRREGPSLVGVAEWRRRMREPGAQVRIDSRLVVAEQTHFPRDRGCCSRVVSSSSSSSWLPRPILPDRSATAGTWPRSMLCSNLSGAPLCTAIQVA